jgi:hypothetical protein
MKHNLLKLLRCGGILAFVVAGVSAHAAVYITGSLTFGGGSSVNGPLNTATAFTEIFGPSGPGSDPVVNAGAIGSYAGVPAGTVVEFAEFAFGAASVPSLWSFAIGPTTYSFDASSVVVNFQTPSFLNISGAGTAYITGYEPTPGTWSVTATPAGPVFTFGSAAIIPEPSAMALFASLGAFAWFARRRMAA